MWNGLDKLIELQKQDVAIAKLDAEAQAIPKAIQLLESKLVQSRATLDAAREVAEQLLKERRAKERELEEASEGIKKKQGRLYEIKTNDEYTAVLKEIAVLKEKSSNLETEILELLERSDKAAKAVTEAEQVFRAAEAVHQKERGEKEILLASLQRELDRLNELRTGQASRLEADLLRHYDRLLKSRGIALVPVKDGSCSGCGVAFPPQAFVEVRRNDRMFTCPSCSRIVYFSG
jgi:predicted  nucleic acid-binding Zn-ribbon protein